MNGYRTERWGREVQAATTRLKLTTTVLNGPMALKDAVRFTADVVEACREMDQLMHIGRVTLWHKARGNCASA